MTLFNKLLNCEFVFRMFDVFFFEKSAKNQDLSHLNVSFLFTFLSFSRNSLLQCQNNDEITAFLQNFG